MSINTAEIQLTDAQRRYVAERAARTGKTWSDVLQGLVPGDVGSGEPQSNGSEQSAYDLAMKLGFIGMSDAGPPDLATNPVHMEGFGQHAFRPRAD